MLLLSEEEREDIKRDSMFAALANDVSLRFLRSMAKDRREGTPLSLWLDSTSARCGRMDCVGHVELPLNPINRARLEASRLPCLQPFRLIRVACRQLLDVGSNYEGTQPLAFLAAHRLLSTFDTREQNEALSMLDARVEKLQSGPAILRAELWLRAATQSHDEPDRFRRYRELLAKALSDASAPPLAVQQIKTATFPDELWQSDSTRVLRHLSDSVNSTPRQALADDWETAQRIIAARGGAIDLAITMETTISTIESAFSDRLRWLFGGGGQLTRPNANAEREPGFERAIESAKYQVSGQFTRLMSEVRALTFLRGAPKGSAIEFLEFQNALLTRYILDRCGGNARCVDALYEVVRSNKGMLAIAYGSRLPASRAMIKELSLEDEQAVTRAYRSLLTSGRGGENADSQRVREQLAPFAKAFGGNSRSDSSRSMQRDRLLLRDGEVVVDIMRTTPLVRGEARTYNAFIVSRDSMTRVVDLGRQGAVDSLVEGWRRAATLTVPDSARWAQATQSLADSIWRKIAAALPPRTAQVFVSPDGRMLRANWPIIAAAGGTSQPVAVLPSWAHLVGARRTQPPARDPVAYVASAPAFGERGQFAPVAARPSVSPSLGKARLRVDSVRSDLVTRESITQGLERARVGMLVTHGTTPQNLRDSLSTFLDRTYVALSGANTDPTARLTATDFARLDLRGLQLLLLVACRMADGAVVEGQGMLGFPLALSAAGAPTSLVSVWPAPNDSSTTMLVESFMRGVAEESRSFDDALRNAQDVVRRKYPEPKYWAGWVVFGDAFGRLR